jgi:hypothetical protein
MKIDEISSKMGCEKINFNFPSQVREILGRLEREFLFLDGEGNESAEQNKVVVVGDVEIPTLGGEPEIGQLRRFPHHKPKKLLEK